ncbi:hypothetical protein TARUN_10253 [Trichoderma arundinaceum]|uniref:Uncharacterized protein n=1 Tax=Trichoderma arundinaceum TaxID=490622 RepID=A0A395N7A4_TRIAR|nr:hypothetical protein TARUN_10253 [Trichoderma arundinaceum]
MGGSSRVAVPGTCFYRCGQRIPSPLHPILEHLAAFSSALRLVAISLLRSSSRDILCSAPDAPARHPAEPRRSLSRRGASTRRPPRPGPSATSPASLLREDLRQHAARLAALWPPRGRESTTGTACLLCIAIDDGLTQPVAVKPARLLLQPTSQPSTFC